MYHIPVLKDEVTSELHIEKTKKYIDATLGDGGHTLEILKRGGIVLGIDVNETSLSRAVSRIKDEGYSDRFIPCLGNFKFIDKYATELGFLNVNGILFDLGYSSFQLDEGGFGLSFLKNEPLDMRLDTQLGVTARDLINSLPEQALTNLIKNYSDEHLANKFAKAIVKARSLKKIQTTKDLADILAAASTPGYEHGRINPATRTFQALRIIVNDELGNLESTLPRAARLLLSTGRMVVISFHSLEDKIVKEFGKNAQPWIKSVNKKPIEPQYEEILHNSRARSAKMRVFEKI
jgi:16S rRNA (cytosine1402-N4)-methyltransferase